MSRPLQQQGTALLLALLIMAMASILLLNIQQRLALDLARSESLAASLRASEYVAGLEALAGKALREDQDREPELDTTNSPWAQQLPALPIPGGVVSGSLTSMDGRFNLNSLLDSNGEDDPAARQTLERLLANLNLPSLLADRILDWIDSDNIPRPQGGEDQFYLSRQQPYLSANQPLAHFSELLLIGGMDAETLQILQPHVSVLPPRRRRINVNLASVPLLMALSPLITEQMAQELHQQGRAAYRNVAEFQSAPVLQSLDTSALNGRIAVTSDYFIARMLVLQNGLPRHYEAMLQRTGRSYTVLWRHAALP
jgi:general secretion pathway protein K